MGYTWFSRRPRTQSDFRRPDRERHMHLGSPDVPETSPAELARLLESGAPLQIMDTRSRERVAEGRIDLVPPDRFHNVPGSILAACATLPVTGLDPSLPVVTVCGHGKDSRVIAGHLNRMGARASSLSGGMAAWTNLLLPRPLDPPQSVDVLIQFDRLGKGCLGYLLISDGEAVIVDPPFDPEAYLEALDSVGARLVGVMDTHVHADYVSGSPALSRQMGVPYYLHPADAMYPYDGRPGRVEFHPVLDGDRLGFGRAALRVVHTPGHTEGSVTYIVEERLALTGDFLFVASVGRPDLGRKGREWAGQLWESIHRARREWSPGWAVYPAHYTAPSERRMGSAVGASFQELLAEHPFLQLEDREAFLDRILRPGPVFPDAYRRIKALNLGLAQPDAEEVELLEAGRSECALPGV